MIHADVAALTFVVGSLIPALVALVTKARASDGTKAVVNALLSAIAGVLSLAILSGGTFDLEHALIAVALTWFSSVAAHFGLLKPAGITGSTGVIQARTRRVGIG